jgi:hypothetical protein
MKLAHRTFAAAVASVSLLAAVPAMAASDYLLTLDDIKDGVTTTTTMELASWSFGASNPTSVGSSGMSSGRRMHKPIRLATPPAENGEVSVVTARERGSGMATGRAACAAGKHFPTATLSHRYHQWRLTEVTVSSCTTDGMTLTYRSAAAIAPAAEEAKISKSRSNIQNN